MVRISNSGSTRSPRAERKFNEKRRAILRAAGDAFRDQGFQATGMRDIAARAELSAANLYYYFASKQEILYFCQNQALERLLSAVAESTSAGDPAPDTLRRVIENHIRCTLDDVEGASAHVEVDALPPELRAKIVKKRDRYERAVRAIVSAGMRSGELASGDATLVTRAILGALNWTARWYRPQGPLTSGKVAAEFATYLVRGLLP